MAGDAISAEELTYWYGDLVAVDHISFNVAEGEILGSQWRRQDDYRQDADRTA